DVRYDLSNILFVTTANQLDTIPEPLLDRMEIIKLSGYILEEKAETAKRYLIPKQMKEHGIRDSELKISDSVLSVIADQYARGSGVRSMENQIKKIMRKMALLQAEKNLETAEVTPENIQEFLGPPVFASEELYEKEIRENRFFDEHFIHLHIPAGATPKDGPSAEITLATALYSFAGNIPVKRGLAMTGELTLTGKILPIGGVREKTIAARRVKVYELIFPKANRRDFEELPEFLKEGIRVHFADFFEEVLKIAFFL
ncbi:MAG TPA: magnesium chelatase domain-containing protein, partial [Leptospiraceae bacterium]|nr:magnesium chelatase domain-containing protein [Leptospiraceae bacterium]